MSARRTKEPRRSEFIKVNVDAETKERLQAIAKAYGWSLSLLCYELLQAWLDKKSLEQTEETE